ncbi:MAG: glycosyltransferase family 39 protein [Candidatus Pacebacteria bacterium]|nr:glycosyltransferase family 39 protein [Candidatus Paceibacterota bacterium]
MNLMSDFKSNYRKLEEFVSVLVVIFSGFMIVSLFKINNFWTFASLDEMLWHFRSRIFWDKMAVLDFSGLIQSAQPGITVYWFTGFLMKFIDFDFCDVQRRITEAQANGLDFNEVTNANNLETYRVYETISFAFNVPLFILMVIFFISFYYLLRKLKFNQVISIFSLFFLSTSICLHYWITPSDKMLNIFLTLSLLTILVHLSTRKDKKYLALSAVFGSLAVLSKLSGLFIVPFLVLLFIYYRWPLNKKKIIIIIKSLFLWLLIFILISIIFLPTIITNPSEVLALFSNSNHIFEQNHNISNYTNKVVFNYTKLLSLAVMGYMTQVSFLSFLSFLFLKLNKKYRSVFDTLPKKHINAIIAYMILFVFMVVVVSKNHEIRFMSPVFVIINIISAIGLYGAVEVLLSKTKIAEKFKPLFYISIYFIAIIFQTLYIISSGFLIKEIF